jgi:DNA-binding response OmpR family regulator
MPKILIVDDEPYVRLLIERTLERLEDYGVEIEVTDNGATALEMIRKSPPNLVFLDVMMPRMNGFDVCKAVKNDYATKDVYIVLLTAKGQEVDRKKGLEFGADMYMTKPFSPDELVAKAVEVLKITL